MMTFTESTDQAAHNVATFRRFCLAVLEYHRTDKHRYLHEAMTLRVELIKSGEFTDDYLNGVADGLRSGVV